MSALRRHAKKALVGAGVIGTGLVVSDRFFAARRVIDHVHTEYFNGAKFLNVVHDPVVPTTLTYTQLARRMMRQVVEPTPKKWEYREVTTSVPKKRVYGSDIVTTFINHATVLVQTHGLNILTDPVWAERASPVSFAGPRRFMNPGVAFIDLPRIDVVLLSHNHYDHMDVRTLRTLVAEHNPLIVTHAGNAAYLAARGVPGAFDMTWFDEIDITDNVRVVSVPAQHNTERWLTDANRTLWGGFVIETSTDNIYFAGDTGYGPFVKSIAEYYPEGFTLGLLPIGSYAPYWYCKPVHTDPDDAFIMKDELQIKHAVAIHHGTFQLGDEPQDEPQTRLATLAAERNDYQFVALINGESYTLKGSV